MSRDPMTLAPGVLERFVRIVGADSVLIEPEERDTYSDPFWHRGDRSYDSSAVLFPSSVEQVQEILRVAGDSGVPVWTSSQGRNNGYGGPSPRLAGSVLLSLRRMNRVLEIDGELAYAVIEPGVTWFELRAALDEAGHHELWFSIPDLGWGSVIGNSLDNGLTYAPNGSDFQRLCGMEVVLADGRLLHTGMGAIPGNPAWHLYPRGFGPVLDPLFLQSNYGIVTKVGIWLMRRPEAYAPLILTVPQHDQLAEVIDIVRELRLDGVLRGVPAVLNTIVAAAQFPHTRDQFHRAGAALGEEQLDALAERTGLGRWVVRTALWGDEPVVAHHLERVRRAWEAVGGRVDCRRIYGRDEWSALEDFQDKVQAGIPSLDIIARTPDNVGHLDFSPVVPLTGRVVEQAVTFASETITSDLGTNHVCAIFVVNDRSCVIVNSLSFDLDDGARTRAAYRTIRRLITEAGERGYTVYRAHIDVMDLVAEQLSYNGHAYRDVVESIKDALDPRGILSPGRHGVWPARFRDGARGEP